MSREARTMTQPYRAMRGVLAVAGLLLAGCAGPDPVLYTLAPQPGPPAAPSALGKIRSVELRRIGLAGYIDRPGIVRAASPYRLNVTQDARWAAPIGPMLENLIAEDLTRRLPGVAVFTASSNMSAQADRVFQIDIQRLDADPAGDVVLQAQVAMFSRNGGDPDSIRSFQIAQTPATPAVEDQVAAMSLAVAILTDHLVQMLR